VHYWLVHQWCIVGIGLVLSIVTHFLLPYGIVPILVATSQILPTSALLLWFSADSDLISALHDLMKTLLEEFIGSIDPK